MTATEGPTMVFDIDTRTRRLVASLPQGDGVAKFDCVADTCRNPVCQCLTVTVAFNARASGIPAPPASPTLEREVGVDLATRTIDSDFRKKATQSDLDFAEALLATMGPADFDLLDRLHLMIKRQETALAKPDEIDAYFDFDEIERSSLLQAYNDVLPFAETMQVVIDGIEYVALDQYCVKPSCRCTDALLSLLPIAERNDAIGTNGSVRVDYKAGAWEAVENDPLPCDMETLERVVASGTPDLHDRLQARHNKLRTIYGHCRKRKGAAIPDSIAKLAVGRNDPCPCGSGKKFKKCCMGKSIPNTLARVETKIIVER